MGIGHQWVKRLFIDRKFKLDNKNPEENENPKDYSFIFATVEDNKALLKSSPAYLQMLSSLPENIRRAHRYGDWDALSGAYFSEFSTAVHTCEPFLIPKDWMRYRAFDYGLDMFACLWVAEDFEGRAYVYRELNRDKLIVSDAAASAIDNTLPDERIAITFAPPDMWSTQKDTGKTMAELFMQNGVPIVRANNNRVQGHLQVKERLKLRPDGKPGLIIFNSCEQLISNLQAIQADEKNPNDCAKLPHEITHNIDALRYYAQSRTLPAEEPEEPEDGEADGLDDYDEFMTGGEADDGYITF